MIKIQVQNFQDNVECKSFLFTSKESFPTINYSFKGGTIYGVISDFGCGSWGLVTCLGGRCNQPDGEVFLNDELIECGALKKHSCFIAENLYDGINSTQDFLTPRKCIEKALSISGLPYTTAEIKDMFNLSGDGINCSAYNGRFNRDLRYTSGEIWAISAAIGFAWGREIFCFPWLNERDVSILQNPFIKVLKANQKIILIPAGQKKPLKKVCDKILFLNRG